MSTIPPKVLKGSVTTVSAAGTIDDSTSPWYGNPKSWNITVTVNPMRTSYPGTRGDFLYDGRDIAVGDWVAGSTGTALQITSIASATSSTVTAVAEDIDLYNTFTDSSGSGLSGIPDGNCLVFDDHVGLAVLTPYVSGYMGDTFSQDIFSRFNYTADLGKSKPVQGGGVIALASATINASCVKQLASGDSIKFQLPTGSNFYLTSVTTNMPLTVQCHSTSEYNDTNPYSFKSISTFLTDDGSFTSGGNTYYGPKNILLQNAEDQLSMNSFWKIINSGIDAGTPSLIVKILSFNVASDKNITVNADGSTTVTSTPASSDSSRTDAPATIQSNK